MNATLQKFGYPRTCVKEFERWVILLRPQQVTLGALVLASKEDAKAFSSLSAEAFAELRGVTQYIEAGLARTFSYDKINYLMLMMVDPDVHFHIVPRYSESRRFQDQEFHDFGWPGPPDLKRVNPTEPSFNQFILAHIKSMF